jgi:uncharacterized protein
MSGQNAIKIVVDTNLWISFCIGTKLSFLADAIIHKKVVICFSDALFNEIFTVLKRPKIQNIINEKKFKELHNILQYKIDFVIPKDSINECRDPKDNFILALAAAARADYLVSGDLDLLDLKTFRGVKIIKADELEKILNKKK